MARSSTLFLAAVAGSGRLIVLLRAPGDAAWAVEDGVGSGPAVAGDVWERTGTCSTPGSLVELEEHRSIFLAAVLKDLQWDSRFGCGRSWSREDTVA